MGIGIGKHGESSDVAAGYFYARMTIHFTHIVESSRI